MRVFITCLTVVFALVSFSAFASDTYMGGTYHIGKYKEDGLSAFSPTGLKVFVGSHVADNIAIEGALILGLAGDDEDYFFTDGSSLELINLEVKLKNMVSVFIKGEVPLQSDTVSLYGKLGLSKMTLDITASGAGGSFSGKSSDNGLSYGIGAAFNLSNEGKIVAEYTSYLDGDFYTYTGIDIGYVKNY